MVAFCFTSLVISLIGFRGCRKLAIDNSLLPAHYFKIRKVSLLLPQTDRSILKNFLFFICFIFCLNDCFAQETIEKKTWLNDDVFEKFQVLKDHQDIKNGTYQALYRRRVPVAQGSYTNNKKTGMWRFYDPKGKLMQVYDYDSKTIRYEAKEYTQSSDLY